MDGGDTFHLLGLLSNSNLRGAVSEVVRSLLLDAGHSGFQQVRQRDKTLSLVLIVGSCFI